MTTNSMRTAASLMDPDLPEHSLERLAEQHRIEHNTVVQKPRSLREIANRHNASSTVGLLFQNTYLLTAGTVRIGCDYPAPVPDAWPIEITAVEKPALSERATEIGARLANSPYDIVALSEVFDDDIRDRLLNAWRQNDQLTDWAQGPPVLADLPPLPLPILCPPLPIPFVPFPVPGTAAIDVQLGSSGLLTLSRNHPIVDREISVYRDRGAVVSDIDVFSAKGILKTAIDVGPGVVSVFSTHIYAGGDMITDPTPAHKSAVRRSEFRQLAGLVRSEQERHPERICIVGGDFNEDGTTGNERGYRDLVATLGAVHMEDHWSRARTASGEIERGPTTVDSTDRQDTRQRCAVGSDSLHCDASKSSTGGKRIDYCFVQKPRRAHRFDIDLQRPRRVYMEMDPSVDGERYLSDHLGVGVQIFARPR